MSIKAHTIRDVLANQLVIREQNIVISVDIDSIVGKGIKNSLVNDILAIQDTCSQVSVLVFGKKAKSFVVMLGVREIIASEIDNVESVSDYVEKHKAQKVVIISDMCGIHNADGIIMSHMTFEDILQQHNDETSIVSVMLGALRGVSSVRRVHIIGSCFDGSLIVELLTASGIGTMIHRGKTEYKKMRNALERDVYSIYQLIHDYGDKSFSVSESDILKDIYLYRVFAVDGQIQGVLKIGSPVGSAKSHMVIAPEFRTDREYFAFLNTYRSIAGYIGGKDADKIYMPQALYKLSNDKKKMSDLRKVEQYILRQKDRPIDDGMMVLSGI